MQTSGLFEKIETEHPGLCIPNVNFMNEPKDWIPNTISITVKSQINLLLRVAISYSERGSFDSFVSRASQGIEFRKPMLKITTYWRGIQPNHL